MAWADELVPQLRVKINDPLSASYSDLALKKLIVVSAKEVYQGASFSVVYTFVFDSGDGTDWDITPDPTESIDGAEDLAFTNLSILKAACNAITGGLADKSAQAIKVKDGDSYVDTSAAFSGYKEILNSGPCQEYKNAISQYIRGDTSYFKALSSFGSDPVYYPNDLDREK